MDAGQSLSAALLAKIHEQIDRTSHLISALPEDRLPWTPPVAGAWSAGLLVGHLLECLAGFCAVLMAFQPERLAHFAELRNASMNHDCSASEARTRIPVYRAHIDQGFALMKDSDLGRKIPTAFVPQGEPLLTLLLGNLEHLINHKHQLFLYLRLMGVPVNSRDLYCFRGES